MTTVKEVNNDKTKMPDEFIFRSVSFVCFAAELDDRCTCKLIYYLNYGQKKHVYTETIVSVFLF